MQSRRSRNEGGWGEIERKTCRTTTREIKSRRQRSGNCLQTASLLPGEASTTTNCQPGCKVN